MMFQYTELSPLVVPMIYFIKLWAKSNDLELFNSYTYTVMIIGYLQVCLSDFVFLWFNDRDVSLLAHRRAP